MVELADVCTNCLGWHPHGTVTIGEKLFDLGVKDLKKGTNDSLRGSHGSGIQRSF